MKRLPHHIVACLLALALPLGSHLAPAWAQASQGNSGQQSGSSEPRDEGDAPEAERESEGEDDESIDIDWSWLERMVKQTPGVHETGHPRVHSAFRDVVAVGGPASVRVFCDGEPRVAGTIVAAEGFILTKASELEGDVECLLQNGERYAATIFGLMEEHDLALLQIEAAELTPVQWNTGDIAMGSWVVTPGLSEMPEAIGVVSARPRLVRGGALGIRLEDSDEGPRIVVVMRDSAASRAGLRRNDVVLRIDDQEVGDVETLIQSVGRLPPGREITVTVLRRDEELTVTATLGSLQDMTVSRRARMQQNLGGPLSGRRTGFTLALQHDTVLHPTQCGGPLLNLDGQAIGINIARAGRVATYALPASLIVPIIEELMTGNYGPIVLDEDDDEEQPVSEQDEGEVGEQRAVIGDLTDRLDHLQESLQKADEEMQAASDDLRRGRGRADAQRRYDAARAARESLQEAADSLKEQLKEARRRLRELEAESSATAPARQR